MKKQSYNLKNEKALLDKMTRALAKDTAQKRGKPYLAVLEEMIKTAKTLNQPSHKISPAKALKRATLRPSLGAQNFATSSN